MSQWLDCRDDWIEADVIRWQETVWMKKSRRAKARRMGERLVTAEIVSHDNAHGFVTLLVRTCQVLSDRTRHRQLPLLASGEIVRRRIATLRRSEPMRLPWSDESVRAQLVRERNARAPKPKP